MAGAASGQNSLYSGGSMIQAAIAVEIRTTMPNAAHIRTMTRRIRSSLSDAHRSIALSIPIILIFTMPDPQQSILNDGTINMN
jgi:hypothetical protein